MSATNQDPAELFERGKQMLAHGQRLIEEANHLLTQRANRLDSQAHDRWMNKTQAATYIGLSYRQLRRIEKRGEISFTGGKIKRSQLDRYIANKRPKRAKQLGI